MPSTAYKQSSNKKSLTARLHCRNIIDREWGQEDEVGSKEIKQEAAANLRTRGDREGGRGLTHRSSPRRRGLDPSLAAGEQGRRLVAGEQRRKLVAGGRRAGLQRADVTRRTCSARKSGRRGVRVYGREA